MRMMGNLVWFVFGGAITGILWGIAGVLWAFTVIGIPISKQCFKISWLCFCPFGKTVIFNGGVGSFLLNMIWIATTGWELAVEATVIGIIFCITIVGIPFGKQYFKIARLALTPFGSEVTRL